MSTNSNSVRFAHQPATVPSEDLYRESLQSHDTTNETTDNTTVPPCPYCNSPDHLVLEGKGPHYGKLVCYHCGKHNKWLSRAQTEALGGFTHQQGDLFGEVQL